MPVLLAWLGIVAGLAWAVRRHLRRLAKETGALRQDQASLQRQIQELEGQRNQARAILESMVEGVAALDHAGRILWLNGAAQRVFGLSDGGAVGRRLTELLRQPDLDALVTEVLSRREPGAREIRSFAPPERILRFHATPCEGGATDATLVLVAQDVTEIRRLEGVRREFVANVSHELKTPLTSIQGLVETLLGGALEDAANNRRFVAMIAEDAKRLSLLIDDLLDLSQIESKALTLRLEAVALRPLLEQLGDRLRQPLEERRVALEIAVPADVPPVRGDPDRLRQIFLNLLDNAIKFNTPGGRVTVRAAHEGSTLSVTMEDTGVGIPAADLPRIFERFYRVDKARSRELGGTGLGLAIVKHLVELHQGRVTVESQPGRGSTLTVILPLA